MCTAVEFDFELGEGRVWENMFGLRALLGSVSD